MLLVMFVLVVLWVCLLVYMLRISIDKVRFACLGISLMIFGVSLLVLVWNEELNYVSLEVLWMNDAFLTIVNSSWRFGIDGISLYFVVLSSFLIVIAILCGWDNIRYRRREYMILLVITDILLVLFFTVRDIVGFYILFESLLIPMFLLIGIWGSRGRRVHAGYQFVLYTLLGSLFMLIGILLIYELGGSSDFLVLEKLDELGCDFFYKKLIWSCLFLGLSIKIPMVPVHLWLPEAHVEAPTGGSVLLAGILLKLGGYGFIQLLLPLGREVNEYFSLVVFAVSVVGVIYTSVVTMRQIDLKKVIAYSSIGHMNYVTLGIFSGNLEGISGAVFLMLSHGFISSGLFICVGILYDRYNTRLLSNYGGIVQVMPLYSILFFFFTMSNIGFPGSSGFIGETLVWMGLVKSQMIIMLLSGISIILSAVYSVWCFNRVVFGRMGSYILYCDVNKRESYMLSILILIVFFIGVRSGIILYGIEYSLSRSMI